MKVNKVKKNVPSAQEIRELMVKDAKAKMVGSNNFDDVSGIVKRVANKFKKKIDKQLIRAAQEGRTSMGVRIYEDGYTAFALVSGYDRPYFPDCVWMMNGVDVRFYNRYGNDTATVVATLAKMLLAEYEELGYAVSTNIKMENDLLFVGIAVNWETEELVQELDESAAASKQKETEALSSIKKQTQRDDRELRFSCGI